MSCLLTVVLDSCVLYSAPLRDLLMQLALGGLLRPRWSDRIHEEWISNLLEARADLTRVQLERTRDLMNLNFADCVVAGYESLITLIKLPDENDRHVAAVAIASGADLIVTFNLRDFPKQILGAWGIEVLNPDDFFSELLGLEPERFREAVRRQRQNLSRPPKSTEEFMRILERQMIPKTVNSLRAYHNLL